jgi:hypothetical protein
MPPENNCKNEQLLKNKKCKVFRLFKIKDTSDLAIQLIKYGLTYGTIGKILGCDRTSVVSFHNRKIKEGIFPKGQVKISPTIIVGGSIAIDSLPRENFNCGKDSYSDYLKGYKTKAKIAQTERMAEAKKTINNLHKWRTKNGLNIKGEDYYFDEL